MTDIRKLLGLKIANLRSAKGFSQMEFAEKIGISTNGLSVIETGKGFLTADTLEKILNILNLEPEELFSFGSIKTETEIHQDILRLLDTIKTDHSKLSKIYTIIKNII